MIFGQYWRVCKLLMIRARVLRGSGVLFVIMYLPSPCSGYICSAGLSFGVAPRILGDRIPLIEPDEATGIELALTLLQGTLRTGFHPR